jgi:hypothetical protein
MKNQTKLPFLRTENLVVKELPDELLIYDLEKNKAFCFNETARLIMEECDGTKTIDEAIESLNRKLKSNLSEEIVWMTIEQLKKADFIEKDYQIPIQTTKVTRRKILQTAATLGIALPIVTSLVAPTAANAQSGCVGTNGSCISTQNGSNCCQSLVCINTESGPTSFTCVGCVPILQPCTVGGTVCCPQLFCNNTESGPTSFQCVPIIG